MGAEPRNSMGRSTSVRPPITPPAVAAQLLTHGPSAESLTDPAAVAAVVER